MNKYLALVALTVTLYMNNGTQQVFEGNYQLSKTDKVQETYTESQSVRKNRDPFDDLGAQRGKAVIEVQEAPSQYYIVSKDNYMEWIGPVSSVASVDVHD